jgi:hypothetical protein
MPLQVIGQHAEKDVAANAFIRLVINRTNVRESELRLQKEIEVVRKEMKEVELRL